LRCVCYGICYFFASVLPAFCSTFYCECAHNYLTMKTQDVIDFFGSRKKVAEKLGVKDVSAISHWGDSVPELRQYQIQVLTKNKLKADADPSSKAA